MKRIVSFVLVFILALSNINFAEAISKYNIEVEVTGERFTFEEGNDTRVFDTNFNEKVSVLIDKGSKVKYVKCFIKHLDSGVWWQTDIGRFSTVNFDLKNKENGVYKVNVYYYNSNKEFIDSEVTYFTLDEGSGDDDWSDDFERSETGGTWYNNEKFDTRKDTYVDRIVYLDKTDALAMEHTLRKKDGLDTLENLIAQGGTTYASGQLASYLGLSGNIGAISAFAIGYIASEGYALIDENNVNMLSEAIDEIDNDEYVKITHFKRKCYEVWDGRTYTYFIDVYSIEPYYSERLMKIDGADCYFEKTVK